MKINKLFWIILGFIAMGMGAVGTVVPMLPTFPFLMLATISFAKGSDRLHRWFIGTRLYKNNLESYVAGHGMTRQAKLRIMGTVTLLMAFGFFMMLGKGLYMPCAILGCVWLVHVVYFVFGVKTYIPAESAI